MSGLNDSIEILLELRDEAERAFSDPLGEDGVYMYDVRVKKEEKVEKTLLFSDCHKTPTRQTNHLCLPRWYSII